MKEEKKGLLKPTLQITALSVLSIFLNFATQLIVAYYFGATEARDAYFAAMIIPTYASTVLVGSIGLMFLPMYVDIKTKKGSSSADDFLGSTFFLSALLSVLITLGGVLFARQIASVTAPGFSPEQLVRTSELLTILFPSIIFQLITNLAGSTLQTQHKFIVPALAPAFSAVITLLFVFLLSRFIGIKSLAYGTLAGSGIACCLLLASLRKAVPLRFTWAVKNEATSRLLKVSAPLLLAGIFFRMNGVFERGIASSLSKGSISYLGYANQMMIILGTITSSGIAITIFPSLSKAWSENNREQVAALFTKGIRFILLLALPMSIIFILWGVPIFQFLFERGAFTHTATVAVSKAFTVLTVAFIATSLGGIIPKIFYFSQKTVLISVINCLETVLYLFLAYALSKKFGYLGLALALSGSTAFSILASLVALIVILKKISLYNIIRNFFVVLAASLIPSIALWLFTNLLKIDITNSFYWTCLTVLLYSFGYLYLLKVLKVGEIQLLLEEVSVLRKKLKG